MTKFITKVGHLITGGASVFADVRTYWSPDAVERVTGLRPEGRAKDGFIHLINSGAAALDGTGKQRLADGSPAIKPWWEVTPAEADECLAATKWCPANAGYFLGGGFSSQFRTDAEMPVTLIRLNLVKGFGPSLQIAQGYTVKLPEEIHAALDKRTDPTWPTTWFVPELTGEDVFTDVYQVMLNWGANHGSFSYGHIGADLITLASMFRIPVTMHNVPRKNIFRPHAWAGYGTKDLEGADVRACGAYGPVYR